MFIHKPQIFLCFHDSFNNRWQIIEHNYLVTLTTTCCQIIVSLETCITCLTNDFTLTNTSIIGHVIKMFNSCTSTISTLYPSRITHTSYTKRKLLYYSIRQCDTYEYSLILDYLGLDKILVNIVDIDNQLCSFDSFDTVLH